METVLSRTALMEHILTLVDDPDSHVYELGAMLEWEPSLSNSVTRKASAWYGLPAPDCTLNLALALLGSRVVKETVKHAITNRATRDLVISVFDVGGFWGAVAAVEHESGPIPEIHCGVVKEQLEDALGTLPQEMRMVLALHYYERLSLEAIARVMGREETEIERLKDQALCRLSAVFIQHLPPGGEATAEGEAA